MLQVADLIGLVRSRGLEPPRLAALTPQASASTNSATTARHSARTSSKLPPREQAAETSQKPSWVARLRRLRGPAPQGARRSLVLGRPLAQHRHGPAGPLRRFGPRVDRSTQKAFRAEVHPTYHGAWIAGSPRAQAVKRRWKSDDRRHGR